jgi:hypothetical protein
MESAKKLEHKIEEKLTLLWDEIEEWQQDNHYIHSGYRPTSNSYIKSARRYVDISIHTRVPLKLANIYNLQLGLPA